MAEGNKKRPELIVPALVHDVLRWLTLCELPRHMVPARIGFLRSLPLTRTGKVARRPLARRPMPTRPVRDHDSENNTTDGPLIDRRDTLLVAAKDLVPCTWCSSGNVRVLIAELGGRFAALRVCQELSLLALTEMIAKRCQVVLLGKQWGPWAPRTLERQRLHDYVAYLRVAVPEWPRFQV